MRRGRSAIGMVWFFGMAGLSLLLCAKLLARERISEAPTAQLEAVVTNLLQARQWTKPLGETDRRMRIEGVVQGVFPQMARAVLWDGTAAAGLRLDLERFPLKPGQRIRVEGRGRFGNGLISLLTPLLVDNDGLHSEQEASGRMWLGEGMHPFQVNYFQRANSAVLRMTWERSGQKAEPLPAEALVRLSHSFDGPDQYAKGLAYDYFEGVWGKLPDFDQLRRLASGVQADVSLPAVARPFDFGLRMKGFLRVPESGMYIFHLISDDGSQLFVQEEEVQVRVIGENQPLQRDDPHPLSIGQPWSEDQEYRCVAVQGTLTFCSRSAGGWDMELSSESGRMGLFVNASANLSLEPLLNRQVRVIGFCQQAFDTGGNRVAGSLLVPGAQEIRPLEPDSTQRSGAPADVILTSAREVRALKPDEAARAYPVRLRGIITDRHSSTQGVLQDSTSGVYLEFDPAAIPQLPAGSFCELSGVTAPGGFAPIVKVSGATNLGAGQFPMPQRLDYAQLVDGSMDCQWVEIEGMVTEILPLGELRISIKGGRVGATIVDPLSLEMISGLSNAFVRVRGCAIPKRNEARQAVGEAIMRVPSVSFIMVDQLAPADPFNIPVKRVAELSQFDPGVDGLRRALVRGQLTYVSEDVTYLIDGSNGLRCFPKARLSGIPGDLVEVAGLSELDGRWPVIREGLFRKTGHAELPEPTRLEMGQVMMGDSEGVWGRIDARLIGSRPGRPGPVLRLESDMRELEVYCQTNVRLTDIPPIGSQLAVSGVVARREGAERGSSGRFVLLVSSPQNIVCLKLPPRWTLRHAAVLIIVMTLVIAVAGLWITLLRRTVEQRTRTVRLEMEERRSAESRVRTLEMQNALETQRARIARNIHDDLGARATKLTRLADTAQTRGAEAAHCLKVISLTARQMVEALDETVWTVNPANDSLARLADYLTHFTSEFFHGTSTDCQLDIPLDLPELMVSAEFRYGLFLLVKEALNNALKHANARTVILKMALVENLLEVIVRDDGKGFDPGVAPSGNGLASMQARAAGLGGKLELETGSAQGTTVRVILPLVDPGVGSGV